MSKIGRIVFVGLLFIGVVFADNELGQAGQHFADGFKALGDFVVAQYKNVQDFFANTEAELKKKVKDTADFLNGVKGNANELIKEAQAKKDQALESALRKVDNYAQQVDEFQNKVRQATDANIQQLKDEWKNRMQTIYNDGLDKIIGAAEAAKRGSGSGTVFVNTFLVSSALLVFVVKFLLQ